MNTARAQHAGKAQRKCTSHGKTHRQGTKARHKWDKAHRQGTQTRNEESDRGEAQR
jgi:hypothetical protein